MLVSSTFWMKTSENLEATRVTDVFLTRRDRNSERMGTHSGTKSRATNREILHTPKGEDEREKKIPGSCRRASLAKVRGV